MTKAERKAERAVLMALCWIGWHKWKQSHALSPIDAFPPFFIKYETPTRSCEHCKKMQRWLPGYGGSEIGCWY